MGTDTTADTPIFFIIREVCRLTTLGRSLIYELVKRGEFPAPLKLSAGASRQRQVIVALHPDPEVGASPAEHFERERHLDRHPHPGVQDARECRCCFADYLITDLPDYFARWGGGFPTVFRDCRKMGRLAGCRTGVGAVQGAARLLRCATALRVTRRRAPDAVHPWP